MKRFISILVALVLVLVCGMQIAAYVGDIVSPCYEVCLGDSPDGHHHYVACQETDYIRYDTFSHYIEIYDAVKCEYCGKYDGERQLVEHSLGSHVADPDNYVEGEKAGYIKTNCIYCGCSMEIQIVGG